MPKVITIDAAGRTLGRVATEAALALRDKTSPTFQKHIAGTSKVKIVNAAQVKIFPKKLTATIHTRHTGWPGGIRSESLAETIAKKGHKELFRLAVKGMLPDNKLKPIIMKHLTVED